MPEFTAPGLGRVGNTVVIDVDVPDNASGVLYALGGFSGGLALFMEDGHLAFEYNLMMIERYNTRSEKRLPAGKHTIQVDTTIAKPGGPGTVVIQVDGTEYARLELKQTVALAFTASETFDVGTDLGSPVSKLYYDRRPFAFSGKINKIAVALK
jgi:arylsulfatase